MMDPELGCEEEEEKESVCVTRDRLAMWAYVKLPRSVAKAHTRFINSFYRADFVTARHYLRPLKDFLKGLKTLPPSFEATPDCLGHLSYASMILQCAVLMTISGDEDPAAFDEEFDQLKPYYAIDLIPRFTYGSQIFGYYLMRLLEKNRIADFHAELESLSATDRANCYIQSAVKVEKLLSRWPTSDRKLLREIYRKLICGHTLKTFCHTFVHSIQKKMVPPASEICDRNDRQSSGETTLGSWRPPPSERKPVFYTLSKQGFWIPALPVEKQPCK